MAKAKLYAVRVGKVPGIYNTWSETETQVKGYPGAKYKSFGTQLEADEYMKGNDNPTVKVDKKTLPKEVILPSISVDAACSGNPGIMEYRGVKTETGEVLFSLGPFPKGTNNIGEYLALVHGLTYLDQTNSSFPIYTDSKTGLAWLKKGKSNSTISLEENSLLSRLIARADEIAGRLYKKYQNKIIKWDTKKWGEIPADFGRK